MSEAKSAFQAKGVRSPPGQRHEEGSAEGQATRWLVHKLSAKQHASPHCSHNLSDRGYAEAQLANYWLSYDRLFHIIQTGIPYSH